jgi:hypothetical protein
MCPCWYTVPEYAIQDQGWCASAIAVHIREGNADGVDLSGQTVVQALDFPEMMFQGGGTARLYVDDRASEAQRDALERIFTGKAGGPMGAVAPLVTTWLPTQAVRIDHSHDGDTVEIAVMGVGNVGSKTLRDGGGNDFTLRGGGFVGGLQMEAVTLAPSHSHWADPDMPRVFDTKSGGRAPISWSA